MRLRAIDALVRLLVVEPEQPFSFYLATASQLAEWKQLEKAAWVYRRMAERFENDPQYREQFLHLLPRIADTYFDLEEWQVAIEFLERLERAYPRSPQVLFRLAEACERAGEHSKAAAHYRTLLRLHPENTEFWWKAEYGLIMMYFLMGEHSRVLAMVDRDAFLYPNLGGEHYRPRIEAVREMAAALSTEPR